MFFHGALCLQLQLGASSSFPPCIGPSRTSKKVKRSSKYCTLVQYLVAATVNHLKVFYEGAFASCLAVVVQGPTRLQQVFSFIICSTKQLLCMLGRVQGVRRCATARTFLLWGGHRLCAYQESLRDSHRLLCKHCWYKLLCNWLKLQMARTRDNREVCDCGFVYLPSPKKKT
jgi:hypothetical protein